LEKNQLTIAEKKYHVPKESACLHLQYWLNCNPERTQTEQSHFFPLLTLKGCFITVDEILAFSKYLISLCICFSANAP